MKPVKISALLFLLMLALIQCKKDQQSVASLPEATQVGANTFGAMVNGTVLVPKKDAFNTGSKTFSAYYTADPNLPNATDANLDIYGSDVANDPFRMIGLGSKAPLQQGHTYSLQVSATNPVKAIYVVNSTNTYTVAPPLTGQLTITKLDQTNRIISGTFYFDAVNATGEKVSVTDGRFDAKY